MNRDSVLDTALANTRRDADESSRWLRRALWLLTSLFVFRLIYTALVPLDLVHDEAYYWDWSRRPDWGYYSKPPMVAWLIAAATRILGSTTFAVRSPSVLLGIGGLACVYALGARMYGRKAGFWAVALAAATPASASLGLLMTIDAPLLFCWAAALLSLWRMWESEDDDWRWLPLLVLTTGIGVLSKQTMLGFIPLAGIFLLTGRHDRRRLFRPAFWIWSLASLSVLIPVVWWNKHHDWITLQHTRGHFRGQSVGIAERVGHFGEFLGAQLAIISPVTWCLLVTVVVIAWRVSLAPIAAAVFGSHQPRDQRQAKCSTRPLLSGRRERFLFCFSGLPLSGVLCLSLWQEVEANWPLAFYPAGVILLVGWALGYIDRTSICPGGQRTLRLAAKVGAACVVLTYLLPFGLGLQGSRLDPVVRLRGWQQLGDQVGSEFAQLPNPRRTFVYVTTGRALTSELAFYMPDQPHVFLWNGGSRVLSQYDLWPGPQDKQGWDAMIVTNPAAKPPPALAASFADVRSLGAVRIEIGNGRAHAYRLWLGTDFGGQESPPK